MHIIWFNWKDRRNPQAGGAELVTEELAQRLVQDGHTVTLVVAGFHGAPAGEVVHGVQVVRVGSRYSVYWKAYRYYVRSHRDTADLVIDEMNTIPFFASWYARKPTFLFVHQLARQIWFYESWFPLNVIGYLLEPVYLWLLRASRVITVSESTKRDLMRFGFRADRISIISEGLDSELEPLTQQALAAIQKFPQPILLSLGAIRPMKRTHHIGKAFEIAKQEIPKLQLIVAGAAVGRYGKRVLRMIERSPYASSISYRGPVSREEKIKLLQCSHLLCATSVKEGWGLIVTEAASQGTPAVVYDVDGLRDSVKDEVTGVVCKNKTPSGLAKGVVVMLGAATSSAAYVVMREKARKWSNNIKFDQMYKDFISIIS